MSTDRPILSALVVEDLPQTLTWLCAVTQRAFPEVDCRSAATLEAAREQLQAFSPDLALIDLGLPDGNGLDLIALLARQAPDCLKLVSTIYDDDMHLFPALRAGADGYLLKDRDEVELIGHLRGMVDGKPALSPQVANRLMSVFRESPDTIVAQDLTAREIDVLRLIAKGYSIEQTSVSLQVSPNTVATHLKRVYQKLAIHSRAEASYEAVRLGLINP